MKKNFGVIIQGPIVSFGSGGKNDNPEGFDSKKTIRENLLIIENFIPRENIVHSGWDTDVEIDNLEIAQHKSKDPYSFDYLNQKRQFYTIEEGFKVLSTNENINYFIKIRTDQLLPAIFWEWITEMEEELDKKILVSEFYNNSPYVFGDFVIGSSRKKFSDFINSQSLYRLSINGSRNMVLKYLTYNSHNLITNFSNFFLMNDIKLFLNFDYLFQKWSDSFRDEFFTIPIDIFKEIFWRGVTMEERFENIEQVFYFESTYSEKHNFESFRKEYKRYLNFSKNYLKKRLKNLL